MGDQLRMSLAERAGVVPAATMSDQRDPSPVSAVKLVELLFDAIDGAVSAPGVGDEAAGAGPVSDAPQPGGEHDQRLVAAAEPGHQNHRRPSP